MIPAEGSAFAFPDVYSQDLRKHILTHPGPPQTDPTIISLQKRLRDKEQQREGDRTAARVATMIPVQLIGAAAANGTAAKMMMNGGGTNGMANGGYHRPAQRPFGYGFKGNLLGWHWHFLGLWHIKGLWPRKCQQENPHLYIEYICVYFLL
jgi:hypothetical protein